MSAAVVRRFMLNDRRRRLSLVAALAVAGCSAAAASRTAPAKTPAPAPATRPNARSASARTVRIALAEHADEVRLTSAGEWGIFAEDGRTPVALTQPGERWVVSRDGRVTQARREDSRPVSAREATLIARPLGAEGQLAYNGKRYRGEVVITATSEGLVVVNRLAMDDYLRGVVPLEIGTTLLSATAAVEAQAITARSYAVTHLVSGRALFDMRATVSDQVYGGAGAETNVADVAVRGTAGLVLLYGGQVVNAPYHSTCGGTTAEPQDVWRTSPEPYLRRVSDQIPGTSRYYCDGAPRYRWTRTFEREELRDHLARYLRSVNSAVAAGGSIRNVTVTDVTPAGRVAVLTIETDRGSVALRGNEMRSALRTSSGEILNSTYFSVDTELGRDGVQRLLLKGGGYGHGVGMCQAGAIGRARAGQDFRTILGTYYPGTTVGTIE